METRRGALAHPRRAHAVNPTETEMPDATIYARVAGGESRKDAEEAFGAPVEPGASMPPQPEDD